MRTIQTESLNWAICGKTQYCSGRTRILYKWEDGHRLAEEDIKVLALDSPLKKMRHNQFPLEAPDKDLFNLVTRFYQSSNPPESIKLLLYLSSNWTAHFKSEKTVKARGTKKSCMTVVLSCMDDKREILCNRRNSYSVLLCKTKRKNGWMNICATFGLIKFGLPVLLRLSTNTSLRSCLWHVSGTTGEPNATQRCVNFIIFI